MCLCLASCSTCRASERYVGAVALLAHHQLAQDPERASAFRVLHLFASGIWEDYARERAAYPELSAAQATKLRQLTILSLAHQKRSLPFAEMAQAVGIDTTHSTRELEDLIVDGIYEGLFMGQLDARAGCFNVDAVTARDVVPPASGGQADPVHTPHDALTAWYVYRALGAAHRQAYPCTGRPAADRRPGRSRAAGAVSYTHLTLPTILLV